MNYWQEKANLNYAINNINIYYQQDITIQTSIFLSSNLLMQKFLRWYCKVQKEIDKAKTELPLQEKQIMHCSQLQSLWKNKGETLRFHKILALTRKS